MTNPDLNLNELDALAEDFLARLRKGERPEFEEVAARHPALAEQIRSLFPTLMTMERLGERVAAPVESLPVQIGEYQIVRVLGQGGMGIVFEAQHASLGRRVALKVLPPGLGNNATVFERFQREARIAARLHHTNIVPIFGTGCENGTVFFAMQFIDGHTLREVMEAVRQLRRPAPEAETLAGADRTDGAASSASQLLGPSGDQYHCRVAELGAQAADALEYAHAQGVLHRDVKPSNLLLDTHGTLWVADFGLATAGDEGELTQTGDVVGTLRYLAPERLTGKGGVRADIYSLGATLYEMLTLRPAFPETDRVQLVQQIAHADPPLPHSLDPRIPPDLETITLKAMSRDPAARYATAAALADDLRRFLTDRPITARRQTRHERVRLWTKRNPTVALLGSTVIGLLLLGAAAASVTAFWMKGQRDTARGAEQRAVLVDRERTRALYRAYLNEARFARTSGKLGQRTAGLQAIRNILKAIPRSELRDDQVAELRNEVVASLAVPDLSETAQQRYFIRDKFGIAVGGLDRIVTEEPDGRAVVARFSDPSEPFRLDPPRAVTRTRRKFSPDGRWLAEWDFLALTHGNCRGSLRVWDCERRTQCLNEDIALPDSTLAFSPNGCKLVAVGHDGHIRLFDLTRGVEVGERSKLRFRPQGLAVHPNGRWVAVGNGSGGADLIEVGTWNAVQSIQTHIVYVEMAWSPDGRWLVGGDEGGLTDAWDSTNGSFRILEESHRSRIHDVRFSPDGKYLATCGWDGFTCLRHWPSGRMVVKVPGRVLSIDGEARQLHVADNFILRRYAIENRDELISLSQNVWSARYSPDGRWLATSDPSGVRLLSASTLLPAADLELDCCGRIFFHPRDGSLTTVGQFSQVRHWPIQRTDDRWEIGPPRVTPISWPQHQGREAAWSADGQTLAVCESRAHKLLISARDRPDDPRSIDVADELMEVALSPNGEWVAAGHRIRSGVTVWRVADGKKMMEMLWHYAIAFSLDNRRMVCATPSHYRVISTSSWTVEQEVERFEADAGPAAIAFSPDGRTLALGMSRSHVTLFAADTLTPLVTLTMLDAAPIATLDFSPDGTRLVVARYGANVRVWDLHAVRRELARFDLDWAGPALTPAAALSDELLSVAFGAEPYSRRVWASKWEYMAERELDQKNIPDAIHAYSEALNTLAGDDPRFRADLLMKRGTYHRLNGSAGLARKDWEEAVHVLAPDLPQPGIMLAKLYIMGPENIRDPQRALPLALRAHDHDPPPDGATGVLGAVYYRLGRHADARALLATSAELSTGSQRVADLFFLAASLARVNESGAARASFGRATRAFDELALSTDSATKEELRQLRDEVEPLAVPK